MLSILLSTAILAMPCGAALALEVQAGADLAPLAVGAHTFHRRLLANGLRCVAVRDEGEHASVFVVIGTGGRDETPATTGLAHLVEHAMFAGTPTTGPDEHERAIKALGGEGNAFTREDYTLFYDERIPLDALGRVLALEADRLRHLSFGEEAFAHERGRLAHEEEFTHRPSDARVQELEACVYRVHPYGAGLRDERGHTRAPGLSAEVARAFYDRHYQPRNACVVVVGALAPEEMLDAIEKAFGALPPGPALPEPAVEPWIAAARTETLAADLPRDRVELVWLVPGSGDSSAAALTVLAQLVGRARLADGTPVEAILEDRVDRRLLRIAASGEKAREELGRLVASARSSEPAEEDLALVRELVRGEHERLPLRARPYFSLAASFGVLEVHGRAQALVEWRADVERVSPLEVRAAAERWLDPARCVTVVFEGTGEPAAPLPAEPDALSRAALDAIDAGDHQRAIEAYTKLLELGPNRMNTVIYLAERGQVQLELCDFDAAIADFERALEVVDYPAVRTLLEDAHARKAAASRGEFERADEGGEGG